MPLTFFKWLDIELELSGKTESIQPRMRRFCLVVVPPVVTIGTDSGRKGLLPQRNNETSKTPLACMDTHRLRRWLYRLSFAIIQAIIY